MFSWISKDEERKKNADVYSSVTTGLQNVYKTKLLPLEKVFFTNSMKSGNFCSLIYQISEDYITTIFISLGIQLPRFSLASPR